MIEKYWRNKKNFFSIFGEKRMGVGTVVTNQNILLI